MTFLCENAISEGGNYKCLQKSNFGGQNKQDHETTREEWNTGIENENKMQWKYISLENERER